jgi:hypothetical protein
VSKKEIKGETMELTKKPAFEMTQEETKDMFGDMSSEHLTIPRMTVLEQLSPEVGEGAGKAGEFYIKGVNQNLGSSPIEVIVLKRSHSYIQWKPLNAGGGIVCQAVDGKTGIGNPGGACSKCKLAEWTNDDKGSQVKPMCDLYENFIIVLRDALKNDEAFPIAISGCRTRLKGLRAFNTLLMLSVQKNRPLFSKSYMIKIVEKSNGVNKYHVFQISTGNNNAVLPVEEQEKAYNMYKMVTGKPIVIEQEQEQEQVQYAQGTASTAGESF